MSKVTLSLSGILLSTLLSLTTLTPVHAAGDNGLFGDYFTNMIGDCSTTSVVTGFSSGTADYGTRNCRSVANILATLFA